MSLEPCPFCGKLFKRLKAHLPHCKMAPGNSSTKTSNDSKKALNTHPKQANKIKTDDANTDKKMNPSFQATSKLKYKSKEFEEMDNIFQNTTKLPNITKSEELNTEIVKPKMKWLAKREREMLKQDKYLTQMKTKINSESQKYKHNSNMHRIETRGTPHTERENVNGQKGITGETLTSQGLIKINSMEPDRLHKDPRTKSFQAVPQCSVNTQILEQIQNNPTPLKKNNVLAPSAREQAGWIYFQTKTRVWDHIKDGLYDKRVSVLATKKELKREKNQASVCKFQTANKNNTPTKASSAHSFPIMQPSPQNLSVLAYTPDMETGYGGTQFFSSHSEIPLCKNESSKFAPYQGDYDDDLVQKQHPRKAEPLKSRRWKWQRKFPVTEQKLADVRLSDLAIWVGAHTPRSPRQGVTMLNKGWQRYYRKYIDVQKGGFGGIAMLIAGYCVLSYIWSYPYLKQERWRKYH